jgi:hypothetical protein
MSRSAAGLRGHLTESTRRGYDMLRRPAVLRSAAADTIVKRGETKINIVSGGYAVCLNCSTRLTEVPAVCPSCGAELAPGTFRLVRDDGGRRRKRRGQADDSLDARG